MLLGLPWMAPVTVKSKTKQVKNATWYGIYICSLERILRKEFSTKVCFFYSSPNMTKVVNAWEAHRAVQGWLKASCKFVSVAWVPSLSSGSSQFREVGRTCLGGWLVEVRNARDLTAERQHEEERPQSLNLEGGNRLDRKVTEIAWGQCGIHCTGHRRDLP